MKQHLSFAGVHTALVTPFRNNKLDEPAYIKLIEQQIDAGIHGIVPAGTTGESPTLTPEEHRRVIELAVQVNAQKGKKSLVIAGTGSNVTSKAIEMSKEAEELGADALLIVAPYYNKPSPEGRYRHFKTIAEAVKIPILLYSIPGRCGIDIPVAVTARLAASCPNIVGIKEAGGKVERADELKAALPKDFQILSGDDGLTLSFLKAGAIGIISVASNLIPLEVLKLVALFKSGHLEEAEHLQNHLAPLFRDLFIESNPVPIKTALAAQHLMTEEVRLPLVELTAEHKETLLKTLSNL